MREPDPTEHADELADVFENHDPTPGEFGAPLPPLMAVKLAAFRRAAAEKELAEAIPLGTARLVAALGGFGVALLPIALTTTAFDPVGPGWLFGGELVVALGSSASAWRLVRDVGPVGDALLFLLAAVSAVALLLAVCDAVDVAPHETWAWKAMVSAFLSAGAAWCVVGAVGRAAGRSGYRRRGGSRLMNEESGSRTTVQLIERAALSLGALPACAAVLLCGEAGYWLLPLPWNVGVALLLASVPLLLLLAAKGRHASWLRACAAGVSAVLGSAVVSLLDPYPGFGVRLALDGWGAVGVCCTDR